jgi:alpha-galactosidase
MKKLWITLLVFIFVGANSNLSKASNNPTIRISTNSIDLVLQVAGNQRLYQSYLGEKLNSITEFDAKDNGREAYQGSGFEDYFEPALGIIHNDGNRCTVLKYVSHEQKNINGGVETIIRLKDDVYPINVTLHYVAYSKENVIKTWSVISHNEKKPVTLFRFASSQLYFTQSAYYLTEFSGDWAKEARMSTQQLQFGKKILDSKLGTQVTKFVSPFFELGLGQPVKEDNGNVLLGTIGWTGNFRFTFEIDNNNVLRLLPSINPFISDYRLKPKETFTTPEFIFTISNSGTGQASRNMQAFARNYQVKDGKGNRMTLLNNWENTFFNFNEQVLADCMKDAKHLGVDMFLLDDGWFGNKYPRNSDNSSLGDWQAMKAKLPNGVPGLIKIAKENGIKFGIWIEPEMVSPKSELYEKHPDWAIKLPNRETYYARNQLVLDLANPKVQDFVFSVVDNLMTENPDLAFFKWDSNSPITNAYSPYLKENQGNMYIDYVRGLYNVLKRIQAKYPSLRMMMCSSGACRCDYEGLKYFTEFWTSDDTDPVERLYIQWGMSQCFPSKVMCAHVTDWNKTASVKFRTDVASMCKLGFDIGLKSMKPEDMEYCQQAIANYNRLKPIILDGNQYRLVSPYESNHTVVMYSDEAKDKAVVFAYNIFPQVNETMLPVKLQGLDVNKRYRIKEINMMPHTKSDLSINDKVYSGDYLMKVGIDILKSDRMKSNVLELIAE